MRHAWLTHHRQGSDVCDDILHSPCATNGHHHFLFLSVRGHIVRRLMLTPCGIHLGKVEMKICSMQQSSSMLCLVMLLKQQGMP